jgi:hypothetical protein
VTTLNRENGSLFSWTFSIWRVLLLYNYPVLCIREKCSQSLEFTGKCISKILDFGSVIKSTKQRSAPRPARTSEIPDLKLGRPSREGDSLWQRRFSLVSLLHYITNHPTFTSSAVCHEIQKQKNRENLNEGKWIPSKSWCRSPGLIRCIGTFISALTKRPALCDKNTSNMADIRRWRHRVTSLQVLYREPIMSKLTLGSRFNIQLYILIVERTTLKPHCIRCSHRLGRNFNIEHNVRLRSIFVNR